MKVHGCSKKNENELKERKNERFTTKKQIRQRQNDDSYVKPSSNLTWWQYCK